MSVVVSVVVDGVVGAFSSLLGLEAVVVVWLVVFGVVVVVVLGVVLRIASFARVVALPSCARVCCWPRHCLLVLLFSLCLFFVFVVQSVASPLAP